MIVELKYHQMIRLFDILQEGKPIYMAIKGAVFDVTEGKSKCIL